MDVLHKSAFNFFQVVTYDQVNHGNSSHHPSMSYGDLANDLVSLMDILDIPKAILIG